MTKVVKLPLICEQTDKDGNSVDYKDVYKILWDLQKQTREIKNKTIQYSWEFSGFSSDYYKEHHEYPDKNEILGKKTIRGYIYEQLKSGYDLYSQNNSTSVNEACSDFSDAQKDVLKGTKSILNYKANQPLDLHNKSITLISAENQYYVSLRLLNTSAFKKYNFRNSEILFKIIVRDRKRGR